MRKGPLSGIKVLDLSSYIAAPYGTTLLADLGAEVLKIQPPGGDTLRHYPSTLPHESRAYLGINRNKLIVNFDAKSPLSDTKSHLKRVIFDRLISYADVVVHNFRPSVPARL